jgi:hypothetical protein
MSHLNERTFEAFSPVPPDGDKAASAAQIWDFGPIGRLHMINILVQLGAFIAPSGGC